MTRHSFSPDQLPLSRTNIESSYASKIPVEPLESVGHSPLSSISCCRQIPLAASSENPSKVRTYESFCRSDRQRMNVLHLTVKGASTGLFDLALSTIGRVSTRQASQAEALPVSCQQESSELLQVAAKGIKRGGSIASRGTH